MAAIEEGTNWGTSAKRVSVVLASERPHDIGKDVKKHNIVEVINQIATLERLLDLLAWVRTNGSELEKFGQVVVCHPCTSSSCHSDLWENDLVLSDESGLKARFEVSDVASSKDGNDKYRKVLVSLRVLTDSGTINMSASDDLLFLAVSEEFSGYIRRHTPKWNAGSEVVHLEVKNSGSTRVFQVLRRTA
jgi:hypothetical protein